MPQDDEPPGTDSFLALIKRPGRGNLKIFLGFAAGVGKTYRMLQEAHALKKKGVDVVVGIVDTHGRQDTERLLEGLEQVPPRTTTYKGIKLSDLDMDALLVRFPELALIDELAHTNAPGSHNKKRWQDVEELLAMGINVMATLNVQHIESLNDDIARLTKVRVIETVPDRFIIKLADEIVDVDLPVNELMDRLEEGKIYPREQAATALRNFFQTHKLTALRELSLREAAKNVGLRASKMDAPPGGPAEVPNERIMVALDPASPNSDVLLRKGARLAGELNTDWDAVWVEPPGMDGSRLPFAERDARQSNRLLAERLGARVVVLRSEDILGALLGHARENRVGKIVVGGYRTSWYRKVMKPDLVDRLLREAGSIDVYVVNFQEPREVWRNE